MLLIDMLQNSQSIYLIGFSCACILLTLVFEKPNNGEILEKKKNSVMDVNPLCTTQVKSNLIKIINGVFSSHLKKQFLGNS